MPRYIEIISISLNIILCLIIVQQIHLNSFPISLLFFKSDILASTDLSLLNLTAAYQYIIDRYDSHYGLVSENEYTDKYWLWSDNVLAAEVLKNHDHTLYEKITKTIRSYIQSYDIKPQTAWSALITPVLT